MPVSSCPTRPRVGAVISAGIRRRGVVSGVSFPETAPEPSAGALRCVAVCAFRLEVRTSDGSWGSVSKLNLEAAQVVCRGMGFDFGTVSSSPCGAYGGSDVCGAAGSPVALGSLTCRGGELDWVSECSWEPAQGASHADDSAGLSMPYVLLVSDLWAAERRERSCDCCGVQSIWSGGDASAPLTQSEACSSAGTPPRCRRRRAQ